MQSYRARSTASPRAPSTTSRTAPQRGFMLDIARKHFSAEWIEARIREMGDLKLNQLQLHLSDDQAVRVESDTAPRGRLQAPSVQGAGAPHRQAGGQSRHITVIPEVDSPGHLGAVIKAHPDLQLRSASGSTARGAIDISNPRAAKIVDDLLGEYADLFPGKYWHLGGDEYQALTTGTPRPPTRTWPRRPASATARTPASQDLATAWLNDRAKTVRKHGKTPQLWNDGMHRGRRRPTLTGTARSRTGRARRPARGSPRNT